MKNLQQKNGKVLVSIGQDVDRFSLGDSLQILSNHYQLLATPGTYQFYQSQKESPEWNLRGLEKIEWKDIYNTTDFSLVINIPKHTGDVEGGTETNGKTLRRYCINQNIGLMTNVKLAALLIRSLVKN